MASDDQYQPSQSAREAMAMLSQYADPASSATAAIPVASPRAADAIKQMEEYSETDSGGNPKKAADTLHELARQFSMAGKNVVHGLTSLPDAAINGATELAHKAGAPDSFRFETLGDVADAAARHLGLHDYQPQNATERTVGNIENALGSLGSTMGAGAVMGRSANALVNGAGNALTGQAGAQLAGTAGGSALSSIAHENHLGPGYELGGALLGGLMPAASVGLRAGAEYGANRLLGTADPRINMLAQRAEQEGIPINAAQIGSSKSLKAIDSVTRDVPLSGASKFGARQQSAFNRAVARTIGLDSDTITPEEFDRARDGISKEFERISSKANVPLDPSLTGRLRQIADDAAAQYSNDTQGNIAKILDRVSNQHVNGVLPGKAFQSIDSMIGKAMSTGGEKSVPLGDIQEALRDAAEESVSSDDARAWRTARQRWRDMLTIQPLVAKDSAAGNISPGELINRVNATKSGKAAMARGKRGDLGDIARIGKQFIQDRTPNSGTPIRTGIINALTGLGSFAAGHSTGNGLLGAAASIGGTVGTARAIQSALRNEALVNALTRGVQAGTGNALIDGIGRSGLTAHNALTRGN